jgi:hypothetical protein
VAVPVRGENVGTAYVRILADGRDLPDSIRDELRDTDKDFEDAGERSGRAYDRGLRKELGENAQSKKAIDDLFRVRGERARRIANEINTEFFQNIERNVKGRYGESIGERIILDIRKGFLQGGGYAAFGEDLEDLFERLPAMERKAVTAMIAERDRLAVAERAAYEERDRRLQDSLRNVQEGFDRLQQGLTVRGEKIGQTLDRVTNDVRELRTELWRNDQAGGDDRDEILHSLALIERGLVRTTPRFRVFNSELDRMATRTGRLFGRGSRNDFLHFFGGMVEGATRMSFLVPRAAERLAGLGKTASAASKSMFEVFRATNDVGKALGSGLAFFRGGAGLAAMATSAASAGVGLFVLVGVLGVVTSAVAGLVGALTALAASLSFAAAGGLGALVGLLPPVAAGIAVVTGAILSMSDAQKKAAKEGIAPLVKSFKDLGRYAAGELFADMAEQSERVSKIMGGLEPIVGGVAVAIREVGNSWLDALEGPGFQRFKIDMAQFLPGAVASLGRIMGNTFGGLAGVFSALIPLTERFLGWLERITGEFARWANSRAGQEAMVRFFERAGDSAASLGGLLKQVGLAIAELFDAGKDSGDSIIDSLADKVHQFVEYLRANPGTVKKWFADAKDIAESVGRAIEGILHVIDELDTPANRKAAAGIFNFMADSIRIVANLINTIGPLIGEMLGLLLAPLGGLLDIAGKALKLLGHVPGFGWAKEAGEDIDQLGDDLKDLSTELRGVRDNSKVNVKASDGGTINPITGLVKALNESIDVANGKKDPSPKASQTGFPAVTGIVKGLGTALDKVLKTKDPKPKASQSNFDPVTRIVRNLGLEIDKTNKKDVTVTAQPRGFDNVFGLLRDLGSAIDRASRSVTIRPSLTRSAAGRIANSPIVSLIGEEGPEAVVPLNRPLSQVDPSVRWLSAIAQGLTPVGNTPRSVSSKTTSVGEVNVYTTAPPEAVAKEVLNTLAGAML